MGIEPYLLTSSVVGVLAQRLVRCLCPHCKQAYIPSEGEILDLHITPQEVEGRSFFKPIGCDHCYGSGYKGRCGIYELMTLKNPLKEQLLRSADAHRLQELARDLGMSSLRKEGALLVLDGKTSSEEVMRATRGYEGM
jgi:general secretion pathway protein E